MTAGDYHDAHRGRVGRMGSEWFLWGGLKPEDIVKLSEKYIRIITQEVIKWHLQRRYIILGLTLETRPG